MFYVAGEPLKQDHWRVEITVPQGALNEEKKQGLVKDIHEQLEHVTGDKDLGVRLWGRLGIYSHFLYTMWLFLPPIFAASFLRSSSRC